MCTRTALRSFKALWSSTKDITKIGKGGKQSVKKRTYTKKRGNA